MNEARERERRKAGSANDGKWREVESGRWKVWGREMVPENPRKEGDGFAGPVQSALILIESPKKVSAVSRFTLSQILLN